LIGNVRREVDRLNGVYTRTLERAGVARFMTHAVLEDAHMVHLGAGNAGVSAKTILIATGSHPMIPEFPGREHVISSNQCFELEQLPGSIVIIGAGYIGMEFASIFRGCGVAVTVIYRGNQVLRDFDGDLRDGLADALRNRGVDLRMDTDVASVEKERDRYRVHLKRGGSISADLVMAATGRVPTTSGLGLERVGVALGPNGEIVVDEFSKTSVENIYAVGDVTDRKNLTPVAIHDANAFAETLFNNKPTPVDYSFIPTAVFSEPEIGTVGLSEEKARGTGAAIDIYKTSFRPLRSMVSGRDEKMLMKLVIDMKTDKVLGAHILGPDAAEIVQMAAIALRLGVTKAELDKTMALHPSAAEELVTLRHKWETPTPVAGSDAAA
jgi:glutathione reductase (NADPH)